MEVIKLKATQREMKAIKCGKTNKFAHEIRPETNALFCELDDEGYVIDANGVLLPRHYDALKLSTEQSSHWFAIEKAKIELLSNRYGKLITYEVNGEEYIKAQVVYYLLGEMQS